MTPKQMFDAIQKDEVLLSEFEAWLEDHKDIAYDYGYGDGVDEGMSYEREK